MRPGPSSHARGHWKRGGGGRRQHPAHKSRGKAKGPRTLEVALNGRLASWQVAAINAGAPSSAGVEYYLAEYLGWEDEADSEEEECYASGYCGYDDEGYGAPAEVFGGALGDGECYAPEFQGWEDDRSTAEPGDEGFLLDGVPPWGFRAATVDFDVQVTEGAMTGEEQLEVMERPIAGVELEDELEQEEEASWINHYEMLVNWKKRQQKRKAMKWKQQQRKWKKSMISGSLTRFRNMQEVEEREVGEEERQSNIHRHVKKTKQEEEEEEEEEEGRARCDDSEADEDDRVEPGEVLTTKINDREGSTDAEREQGDPGDVVAETVEETKGGEVEQQPSDDDFDFCNLDLARDYLDEEEDWCVVGAVVEM